jgi:DNA-binding NarL/FixJ family response regulator
MTDERLSRSEVLVDGVRTSLLVGGRAGDDDAVVFVHGSAGAAQDWIDLIRPVSAFLLKDVAPADFVKAIRIVAAGDALLAPSVTRRLLGRFAQLPVPGDAAHAEGLAQLTDREREVLELVALGLSNREIAERLTLAEPTVKTHVSHLLLKLDLRDRAQLVALAYESGIVRPGSGGTD